MIHYTVQDLVEEYVFQRQHAVRPDQAMNLIKELRPDLTADESKQLNKEIRDWEAKQAASAPPPPQPQPKASAASLAPPKDLAPSQPPLPQNLMPPSPFASAPPMAPQRDPAASQPIPPAASPAFPPSQTIACPHCGTLNPAHSKYCYSCGQLLGEIDLSQTERLFEDEEDPASFGHLSSLVITVRGFEDRPVVLDVPTNHAMLIGRSDPSSSKTPDIDLAMFSAKQHGVSRIHAMLQRLDRSLTLTDRGSVNYTYINGEKIYPNEVRVIRDGDEVRFGRLTTRFTFKRELRRL